MYLPTYLMRRKQYVPAYTILSTHRRRRLKRSGLKEKEKYRISVIIETLHRLFVTGIYAS